MDSRRYRARVLELFAEGVRLFNRVDGAFLLSRVALVVPVLVASRTLSPTGGFSTFSEAYHVGLFLAGIALYGAHEAYLVDRTDVRSGLYHILVNSVPLAVAGLALRSADLLDFSLTLFVFALLFRAVYLYFITLHRHQPRRYVGLAIVLVATCGLMALRGEVDLYDLVPLIAAYAVLGVESRALRFERILSAIRSYLSTLREHFFYVGNYLLSSMYVQGALFVYAFTASAREYSVATHFVYVLGGTYILLDLIYRQAIDRFAREERKPLRVLLQTLAMAVGLAVLIVLPLVPLMPWVESILFANRLIDATMALILGATALIHSTNFAWSAFLVGTGRIKIQFRLTALTGIILVLSVLALEGAGIRNALAPAFVVTSLSSSLLRGGTTFWILRRGVSPA